VDFVTVLFSGALVINFVAAGYAFYIRSLMKGGALQRVAFTSALSALVFGFHHLGEVVFEHSKFLAVTESVESVAGLLLIWAIYELYLAIKVYIGVATFTGDRDRSLAGVREGPPGAARPDRLPPDQSAGRSVAHSDLLRCRLLQERDDLL
jgi:hypothetical protein